MSSATPVTSSSLTEFSARLDRIKANNGQGTLMVGKDEQHAIPRKEFTVVSRQREIIDNALYPASLIGALLLGMIVVALSRYIRFQMMAAPTNSADAQTDMIITLVISLASSFVLSQAFKLTSKEHRGLQMVGIFLMASGFHNLCHWIPGPMSAAFSPDYVQQTIATSPANSLHLWNGYFPLIEAEAAPQAAPPSPATIPAIVPAKILAVTKATDAATKAAAKILPKVLKAGKLVTK